MKFEKGDRAKQIRFVQEKNPFVTVMRVSEGEWIYHKHDDVEYKNAKDYGCCNSEDLVLIENSTLSKKKKRVEKKKFYGHPKFYELLEQERDLHSRKNYNYAKQEQPLSNFYASERIGIPAPLTALGLIIGKTERIKELLFKEDLVNESILDTALDNSVYYKLFIILWEKFLKNKNAKKILQKFKEVRELLKDDKEI